MKRTLPESQLPPLDVNWFAELRVSNETKDDEELAAGERRQRPKMALRDGVPRLEGPMVGVEDGEDLKGRDERRSKKQGRVSARGKEV